jgi:SAM-dependent methyltransferase
MMLIRRMAGATIGLALLWYCAGSRCIDSVSAQTTATGQAQRPTSTPYKGDLSIFEYPDRDEKLHVDRVMDLLGIVPGRAVADVGAGSGWFTVRAAARVGAGGVVYAEDINPEAIDYITKRASREKLENVRPVLGTVDDTKLPAKSVDAILILKTYHEMARPIPLMEKLRLSLRPGGKVGIIDRNGDGTDHGTSGHVRLHEERRAGLLFDF